MERIIFRKGNKVSLGVLAVSDAEQICTWLNDPEVTKYLSLYKPMTLEEEKVWLEMANTRNDTDQTFAIITKDGEYIGNIGLHYISHLHGAATSGAVIGNKKYWGKDYGGAAKELLLEYAFNTLNLRKVNSEVFGFNERSLAYLKQSGYTVDGVRKEKIFADGEYHDEVLLSITRAKWEKNCKS